MKKLLSSFIAITMLVSLFSVNFVTSASTGASESVVYYYSDFNDESEIDGCTLITAGITTCSTGVSKDGSDTTVLRIENTGTDGNTDNTFWPLGAINSFVTIKEAPVMVLEYRARAVLGEYDFFGTGPRNQSVIIGGKNYHNKIREWTNSDSIGKVNDESEWNTYTVVYSNTDATKTVYVNGTLLETCADSTPASYSYSGLKFKFMYLPLYAYLSLNNYVEYDYVKLYTMPGELDAEMLKANTKSIVVEFSNLPFDLNSDNFTLSDETKIKSVEQITDKTFRIIPEKELDTNTQYTLTAVNVKDTLAQPLKTTSFTFTTGSASDLSEENVHYFDTFDADNSYVLSNDYGIQMTVSDSVMKFHGAAANNWGILPLSTYAPETPADTIALEYKARISASTVYAYLSTTEDSTAGSIVKNGIYAVTSAVAESKISDNSDNQWHTITVLYNLTDDSRDFYVDGKLVSEKNTTTYFNKTANPYKANKKITLAFKPYLYKATDYSELDYAKIYVPVENFGAEIVNSSSVELDELVLDFNSTVYNLTTDNLRVDGKAPASIELIDEENQKYKVVLSEKLKPGSAYKVDLNGVTSTMDQVSYDEIKFTTRMPEGNEVYYDISGSGDVKSSDGTVIANNSFETAESISLRVKANQGYDAVVKVNGENVNAASYGKYDITVTDGAYIEINFVAVEAEVSPEIISIPDVFVEGNTSYTFARINKAVDNGSLGVIVSRDKNEPVIEDVDSVSTFKFTAINGSNAYGEFGIGIRDKSEDNVLGNTYYVRPYAIYNGLPVYGASLSVIIK